MLQQLDRFGRSSLFSLYIASPYRSFAGTNFFYLTEIICHHVPMQWMCQDYYSGLSVGSHMLGLHFMLVCSKLIPQWQNVLGLFLIYYEHCIYPPRFEVHFCLRRLNWNAQFVSLFSHPLFMQFEETVITAKGLARNVLALFSCEYS